MDNLVDFFIDLETTNRDLAPRLIVAAELAKRGFTSIVAQRGFNWRLIESSQHTQEVKRGVLLLKSANLEPEWFRTLSKSGVAVTVLDEEGLYPMDSALHWRRRISDEALRAVDHFMAWGSPQRQAMISRGVRSEIVTATGNPRIDLWEGRFPSVFAAEKRELKRRFGSYALVALNITPERAKLIPERELLRLDKTLMETCQRNPSVTFLVRPHPGGADRRTTGFVRAARNARIFATGSSIPLSAGAEFTLHTGSTVGLESLIAGSPTGFLSINPGQSPQLAMSAGTALAIEPTVVQDFISLALAGRSSDARPVAVVIDDYYSTYGQTAVERVVDVLQAQHVGPRAITRIDRITGLNAVREEGRRRLLARMMNSGTQASESVRKKYLKRLPESTSQVEMLVAEYAQDQHFSSPRLEQLARNAFLVEPRN